MTRSVIFGSHEEGTLKQFEDVASRAERSVLCADDHFGYVMPVGGVCAYRNHASVIGVGYDIACGNAAILTDLRADTYDDEQGRVWVGVHFGSRGLGHHTASGFLALSSGAKWGDKVKETEVLLDLATPLGDAYWAAMDLIHNHHNFAWKETHNSAELVVVRKGATPAFPGQRGFVGGSMGDNAVIIEGVDTEASRDALYSTVHGAGRVMGRNEAKRGRPIRDETGKVTGRDESRVITREMPHEWLSRVGTNGCGDGGEGG